MSNLQGFLGKLEVTNEIGEALDKQLQLAESQTQQYVGGSSALRLGAVKVGELGVHVDKDLAEGKLVFENDLVASAYVKAYLRRASEVLLNLAEKSKSEELVSHGKVAALRASMEVVKKYCISAKARVEQLLAAAEEAAREAGTNTPSQDEVDRRNRRPGQHPGPSSLAARRAERDAAQAEAQPVEAESKPEEQPSVEAPPADLPVEARSEEQPPAEAPAAEAPVESAENQLTAEALAEEAKPESASDSPAPVIPRAKRPYKKRSHPPETP